MSYKVYLDPGHGGSDPGAASGGLKEKDLTLTTSLACRDYLQANGVTVKMSRTKDQENSLNGSCAESNRWKPDCHVSIHYNAGGGDGAEVWHTIYKSASQGDELGTCILDQLKKLGQQSRGLKTKKNAQGTDYFGAIRMTNAPAVIVECGFIDNATDRKLFDTAAEQKKIGQAIAKGILKWLGAEDDGNDKPSNGGSGSSKPASKPEPERKISDVYNPNKSLTVSQAVKAGQAISNIILGTNIAEDGKRGSDTRKNATKILQWAMNKDYDAGLEIDGKAGTETKAALGQHTVRLGETQYMVTALEVLLLLGGYNPHGVELPGEFGSGCAKATGQYQSDTGLKVDRIGGRDTFLRLIV